MKKILSFIALILLLQNVQGSTKTYHINFLPEDFRIVPISGDTCMLLFHGNQKMRADYCPEEDYPRFPVISFNLLIPQGSEIEDYTFTTHETELASDCILDHGHHVVSTPLSKEVEELLSKKWYESRIYLPDLRLIGTSGNDQYPLAAFYVMPIKYDAGQKQVSVCSFDLTITYKEKSIDSTKVTHGYLSEQNTHSLRQHILNETDLKSLSAPLKASSAVSELREINDYYILVTADSLKDSFMPLLEWKRYKGLKTHVITIEEIAQSSLVSADTGAVKFKNYIEKKFIDSLYNNCTNTNDIYLLLGGDVESIPTFYEKVIARTINQLNSFKCDTAIIPIDRGYDKCIVSRYPARNKKDVVAFTNKLINYELGNVFNGWGEKTLFSGKALRSTIKGRSDADLLGEQIADNVNISDAVIPFFDTRTTIPEYQSDADNSSEYNYKTKFDVERIAKELRNNYSLIYMITHGDHDRWSITPGGNENEFYVNSMADTLTSAYPKVILTDACLTNSYDMPEDTQGPSLSEVLIRNPNSGIVAFVGSIRNGFFDPVSSMPGSNEMPYVSYSPRFSMFFLDDLFNRAEDEGHLGKMVLYGLRNFTLFNSNLMSNHHYDINDIVTNNNYYDLLTYYFYLEKSIACIGDPEMQIFSDVPKDISSDSISFEIEGDNIIMHYSESSDKEDSIYTHISILTDAGIDNHFALRNTDFSFSIGMADSAIVTIYKHNYRPKIIKLFHDVINGNLYIQNITLSNQNVNSKSLYFAPSISIGSYVTNKKPTGRVIIKEGLHQFNVTDYILLQDGVEAQQNSEIEIKFIP